MPASGSRRNRIGSPCATHSRTQEIIGFLKPTSCDKMGKAFAARANQQLSVWTEFQQLSNAPDVQRQIPNIAAAAQIA
jgi:hypothetical protein